MTRLHEVLEFSFELPLNFVVHDVPFPLNAKKTADDKSDVFFLRNLKNISVRELDV